MALGLFENILSQGNSRTDFWTDSTVCVRMSVGVCSYVYYTLWVIQYAWWETRNATNDVQKKGSEQYQWQDRLNFIFYFPEELIIMVWGASISWPQARGLMWKQGFSDIYPVGIIPTLSDLCGHSRPWGGHSVLHWQTATAFSQLL